MSGQRGGQPPARLVPDRTGDGFYRLVVTLGRGIYRITSRSVRLHRERSRRPGGLLMVANHTAPYDIPCLMDMSHRPIDFISLVEFGRKPLVGTLFRKMNAMFLDRATADSATLRQAAKRLRAGHVVCIFPEAEMRDEATRATASGHFYPGFGQLALLGRAPILPVTILGSAGFSAPTAWLPWPKVRWGGSFGEVIPLPTDCPPREAAQRLEAAWLEAQRRLESELEAAMAEHFGAGSALPPRND